MLTCTRCGESKPDNKFSWRCKSKGKRASACKDCHTALYDKPYYQKNKEKFRAKAREQYRVAREFVFNYKATHPCIRCGENHIACLQFHHRDSELKDMDISSAFRSRWSIKRLEKEISKCDILCANCHFKLHWDQRFKSARPHQSR